MDNIRRFKNVSIRLVEGPHNGRTITIESFVLVSVLYIPKILGSELVFYTKPRAGYHCYKLYDEWPLRYIFHNTVKERTSYEPRHKGFLR